MALVKQEKINNLTVFGKIGPKNLPKNLPKSETFAE
jgi:hypothetical protein